MARPDFPVTVLQFQSRFATEEAAWAYVRDSRWPDGFRCPRCGGERSYPRADRRAMECAGCGRVTSVTAGTVMSNTKLPLKSWLWAAWLMVSSKRGLSASELGRQAGVSLESAFTVLHKLRKAMVAPGRERLRGRVEVDETVIGGPEQGRRGRGAAGKELVVGAVEVREKGPGRLRLRHVEHADSVTLHKFVRENVEEGATLVTDGLSAYDGLYGYRRVRQVATEAVSPDDVLACFHTAASNLKTWLKGTHHGRVGPKHLQAYLDEFAFRYNRRGNLGAAFQRLLGLASSVGTLTYDDLYGAGRAGRRTRRARGRGRGR